MITIRVGNVNMYLEGRIPLEVIDEIQETMSYVVPGHRFMPRFKKAQETGEEEWDGTKTVARRQRGRIKAPTGLYSYVLEILKRRDLPYQTLDERPASLKMTGWSTEGFEPRDYQRKPMDAGLNRARGVMQAATGAGKTEMVIGMTAEARSFPAIFYVNSCDLLEQAYDRFRKYIRYNGEPAEIGRVGGGHFDIQPITIATVQTTERALTGGDYHKYMFDDVSLDDKTSLSDRQNAELAELVREAQFTYVDECHHVSCDTIQSILNNSHSARYRYGGSASPWRDDGLDILIEAAFGRRFCAITASYLIKNGYLVRPNITFNHFRQKLGPASNWGSHYTKYVVENDARNEWIAERAHHYIEREMPTIILVQRTKHGERILDLVGKDKCELLTSSGKKKKSPKVRKVILDKMRKRELMCIIATTLLDEGVDVPAASAGIFAGGGKSSTRALQRVGRFIRKDPNDPNKDGAEIEEIWDHTKWLSDHAKTRRRIFETEPEFNISSNSDTLEL
jgi:superfamily II DNA or RNA helicase